MKKIFLALLCSSAVAQAFGAGDCAPGDACSQPKKISPFMAEVTKAAKPPELKQGKPLSPELKQGKPLSPELKQGRSRQPELKPAPVQTSSAAASAAQPAQPPAVRETFSKPAWLLAVFVLLAGLYCYLKEGNKRGKKN